MGIYFPLRPSHAWLLCCCWSGCFVVSLYLVPPRIRAMSRDNPTQIKARYISVSSACLLAVAGTSALAEPRDGVPGLWRWLGIHGDGVVYALTLPLMLTACLFLGPLVTMVLMAWIKTNRGVSALGVTRRLDSQVPLSLSLTRELKFKSGWHSGVWATLRNLVVGPVTEEVVFRGCFMPPLLCAGIRTPWVIWLSPLIFGLAHVHHAREQLRQGYGLLAVLVATAFQMTYTSIFGAYAAFIHLRTGHLVSSVLVHAFCNYMGVPDLSFAVQPGLPQQSTATSALHHRRRGLWCVYVIGMGLFAALLFPITRPSLYKSILWSARDSLE